MAESKFGILVDEDGKRVDLFLSERLFVTRTKVKVMIEEGHVRLDGKAPKPSARLKKGAFLEGEIPAEEPLTLAPEPIPIFVLYEDAYILAINKPNGMVVHPSPGHWGGTLVNAVLAYLGGGPEIYTLPSPDEEDEDDEASIPCEQPEDAKAGPSWHRPGIVHRLDKGTTGVILVAKDTKTQELLSALFKSRGIHKTYRAVVEGVPAKDEGMIDAPIGRHPVDRKRMAVARERGKEAETRYRVLRKMDGFSYVEAYPRTGRTHQIRVHLAHEGHPVVGDDAYGKKAKDMAERPLLHAFSIAFTHPVTGEEVSITAPVPRDMEEFIAQHAL